MQMSDFTTTEQDRHLKSKSLNQWWWTQKSSRCNWPLISAGSCSYTLNTHSTHTHTGSTFPLSNPRFDSDTTAGVLWLDSCRMQFFNSCIRLHIQHTCGSLNVTQRVRTHTADISCNTTTSQQVSVYLVEDDQFCYLSSEGSYTFLNLIFKDFPGPVPLIFKHPSWLKVNTTLKFYRS